MALLKVVLIALSAASQESKCDNSDSVSDLCLLQLKGEAETQEVKASAMKEDSAASSGPCMNADGPMSEFECDSHVSCYWTPSSEDISEGTCTSCSLCVSEPPGKENMIVCGCGVCGTTDDAE